MKQQESLDTNKMGGGEESTPTRPTEPNLPSYPDWSISMQAYYGGGATPPFFPTTVAPPPTPHPYTWGTQHAFVPPYGTPVPYPALYPPAGVYPYPNMPPAPNAGPTNMNTEAKARSGKDQALNKKMKLATGGKAGSGSGNEGATLSGSEGSSGESDDDDIHGYANKKGGYNQMIVDGSNSQNAAVTNVQSSILGNQTVPGANLNIEMNLWNANTTNDGTTNLRPNSSNLSQAPMIGSQGVVTNRRIHDDRDLKREKRKQSNRESARRSRLRKQAECEELQAKVEKLTDENQMLRDELQRLSEGCHKLASENSSIEEELSKVYGSKAVSDYEINNLNSAPSVPAALRATFET